MLKNIHFSVNEYTSIFQRLTNLKFIIKRAIICSYNTHATVTDITINTQFFG